MRYTDEEILKRVIDVLSTIEEPITYMDIVSVGMVRKVEVNQPYIKVYLRNIYRVSRSPAAFLVSSRILQKVAEKIEERLLENRLTQVEIIEEGGTRLI